ncbi:MAG: ZIP family metal transporter [Clostridia bacterium]|nr:ZIP family metal transporter [Clostridia bacterium]
MTDTQISILGIVIIFVTTSLGSSLVYFFKNGISDKANTIFLGFAGGVMVSASFFSLLLPAIEETTGYGSFNFLPATLGFLIGGLFLVLLDKVTPHFHKGTNSEEGPNIQVKKSVRLFLAVTLHNIPEGLAVGFALGSASSGGSSSSIFAALALAIGIGVQNFAEGAALALPMSVTTKSRHKAFGLGTLSGLVEPIFAIAGYFLASYIQMLQPWLLAFAAGAMIFVVIEDLIPDAKSENHEHLGTWSAMLGFVSMMILDVIL